MSAKVLIAGVGNIFLGDDAFGVEVAQRLAGRTLPEGVQVVDFGIRGFDLAFALMDAWDAVILVDAMARGVEPGTVAAIEPDLESLETASIADPALETHGMHPANVLRMVKAMGGTPPPVILVACEPQDLGGEDGRMGLSEPVQAAVDQAVVLIERLVQDLARRRMPVEAS